MAKRINALAPYNDRVEQHRPRVVPRIMQLDHQDGSVIVRNGSANGGGYDCSNAMLYGDYSCHMITFSICSLAIE